jgi:hypothetical protein
MIVLVDWLFQNYWKDLIIYIDLDTRTKHLDFHVYPFSVEFLVSYFGEKLLDFTNIIFPKNLDFAFESASHHSNFSKKLGKYIGFARKPMYPVFKLFF